MDEMGFKPDMRENAGGAPPAKAEEAVYMEGPAYSDGIEALWEDDEHRPVDMAFVESDVYYIDDSEPALGDDAVKEIVGEAISYVDGVLGLKGGLADVFKADEDLTRGIHVHQSGSGTVTVKAKVITETGYDSAVVMNDLIESVADALQMQAGLRVESVDIEVAETLTRTEFLDKYSSGRAIN